MPQDTPGECNAHLHYLLEPRVVNGAAVETTVVISCNQPTDHTESHKNRYMRGGKPVETTWEIDERNYNIYEDCRICDGRGLLADNAGEPYGDVCDNCEGKSKLVIGDTRDKDLDYD